jgi:hypothetical protein
MLQFHFDERQPSRQTYWQLEMKSSRLFFAIITMAVAFFFTLAASIATAGSMGNGAAQRQKLVIESIDATTGTVEFKSMVDNTIHNYLIDATTRIFIGTTKGTIDQIKVRQKVENFAVKEGQPPQTLKFIFVSQAALAPVPPAAVAQ